MNDDREDLYDDREYTEEERDFLRRMAKDAPPPPPEGSATSGELRANILALQENARRAGAGRAWTPGRDGVPTQTHFTVPRALLEAAYLTDDDVPDLRVADYLRAGDFKEN